VDFSAYNTSIISFDSSILSLIFASFTKLLLYKLHGILPKKMLNKG
jgi:hypothetical protein